MSHHFNFTCGEVERYGKDHSHESVNMHFANYSKHRVIPNKVSCNIKKLRVEIDLDESLSFISAHSEQQQQEKNLTDNKTKICLIKTSTFAKKQQQQQQVKQQQQASTPVARLRSNSSPVRFDHVFECISRDINTSEESAAFEYEKELKKFDMTSREGVVENSLITVSLCEGDDDESSDDFHSTISNGFGQSIQFVKDEEEKIRKIGCKDISHLQVQVSEEDDFNKTAKEIISMLMKNGSDSDLSAVLRRHYGLVSSPVLC